MEGAVWGGCMHATCDTRHAVLGSGRVGSE